MKKCKTCGKEFMFAWPCNEKDYAWKRCANGNLHHYFCSYSCMKIYDNDKKKGAYGKIRKRVRCVELNKTFSCASEACTWLSLNGYALTNNQLRAAISNNRTAAGYHWRYDE